MEEEDRRHMEAPLQQFSFPRVREGVERKERIHLGRVVKRNMLPSVSVRSLQIAILSIEEKRPSGTFSVILWGFRNGAL